MERTHKPIGHFWSCPSRFQQSIKYREMRPEDFVTPFGKVLVPGADDDLTKSERSAKRRRVEGLAQGFLDGRALLISSAAANGVELRETVERALKTQGLAWDDVVADEGMICHGVGVLADGTPTKRLEGRQGGMSGRTEPSIADEAKPGRFTRSAAQIGRTQARDPVSTTPSVEALAHAARLQARKLRPHAGSSVSMKNRESSNAISHDRGDIVTQSSLDSFRQPLSQRDNVQSLMDSSVADELRLSCIDTPSRKLEQRHVPVVDVGQGKIDEYSLVLDTAGGPPLANRHESPTTLHLAHDDSMAVNVRITSTASDMGSTAMSMCTAFRASTAGERGRMHSSSMPPASLQKHAPESETALDGVYVEPPRTWTAINGPGLGTRAPVPSTMRDVAGTVSKSDPPSGKRDETAIAPLVSSGRATRRQNLVRAAEGASRAKPKGGENNLLKSFKQAKPGYQSAPLSQGGTTPLMYKKRGRPRKAPPPEASVHTDKLVLSEGMLDVNASPSAPARSTAHPPLLDVSFGDDSFAPKLNMALVDEHLNKRLPRTPHDPLQRSSLRSALRKQMRDSGATLERASSEPSSSQLDAQHM
ncbi:hypothetical protein LTR95_017489, partial [Oleoguttula sp. CCFEE 5521]